MKLIPVSHTGINFIHIYAILFIIELAIMLLYGRLAPLDSPWTFTPKAAVDMTPWRFAIPSAIVLVSLIITLYLIFSPIGFVNGLSNAFWPCMALTWGVCFIAIYASQHGWKKRYEGQLKQLNTAVKQ